MIVVQRFRVGSSCHLHVWRGLAYVSVASSWSRLLRVVGRPGAARLPRGRAGERALRDVARGGSGPGLASGAGGFRIVDRRVAAIPAPIRCRARTVSELCDCFHVNCELTFVGSGETIGISFLRRTVVRREEISRDDNTKCGGPDERTPPRRPNPVLLSFLSGRARGRVAWAGVPVPSGRCDVNLCVG